MLLIMGTEVKTIYVALSGGFGPLAQVLPTLEQLKKDNHKIICSSTSKAGSNMLKTLGYDVIEFPILELPKNIIPKGPNWWNLDFYWGKQGYFEYDYVKQLVSLRTSIIKDINPDLIITMFNPPASIAAKILDIPLVSFTQSCMHPDGKRVQWWEEPDFEYSKASTAVNEVLNDYGKQPINIMEDLNKGDLTIISSFPEFDPVTDQATIYIGPSQWDANGRNNNYLNASYRQKDKPLIYAYTGHMYDTSGPSGLTILENVLHAFQDTEYDVIISTGADQILDNVPKTSSNITITDWVPTTQLAKECSLMVHHGGHGSCMLGLVHGIPSVVTPTFSEREFNARQLEEINAGTFITPDNLTPSYLLEVVNESLNNNQLISNAKRWSEELQNRAYGGPLKAKEHIMKLIY